jgi:hypothetical protein
MTGDQEIKEFKSLPVKEENLLISCPLDLLSCSFVAAVAQLRMGPGPVGAATRLYHTKPGCGQAA